MATLNQIPRHIYHADLCQGESVAPSLSNSFIKVLLQSARKAKLAHPRLNPAIAKQKIENRFDVGTVAHNLFLERGKGSNAVMVDPNLFTGKQGGAPVGWTNAAIKAERDRLIDDGKIPLLPHDFKVVNDMASEALRYAEENPMLAGIFNEGLAEHTILWQHRQDSGFVIECRAMLDMVFTEHGLIVDYKTTEVSSPNRWIKSMVSMGYDVQAAWYTMALNALNDTDNSQFMFVVQETSAPYECYTVIPDSAMIVLGMSKIKRAMNTWEYCMETGNWNGYPQTPMLAAPAPWDLSAEEEELGVDFDKDTFTRGMV